ncbi:pyruvate, water dikinase [Halarchaeum salinum]|uniref:Probable phosphoenolpyruvate synthase n=1 Tax=Halarchaeum salinum TaxID=489912 RepID=A0AAV3S4X1_9EURY
MPVRWLADISAEDVPSVGGKGASLGELTQAGLPVPSAFVVTADTYRTFLEESGVADELFAALDVDPEDSAALAEAAATAKELVLDAGMPDEVRESVLAAYDDLGDAPFVAVRSSATAEDLPDASFAGQQETYLNVTREDLLERVKRCWASLFTQRAIYYREEQGFDHERVDIAVVVQRMVDAEKSGVLFTSHPSTGAPTTIVEAAWGLGEGVVSGSVSPDNYVIDRESGEIEEVTVATKKTLVERDPATGETTEREVSEERRDARVLDEAELTELLRLGERVEEHYDTPQDVEWAIADGEVYMLQSRPITTIDDAADATSHENDGETLVSGLGASPGIASGAARIVGGLDQLDKVGQGDVIVTSMTTPDMVPAMKRASGIVTDEGGMTSHAAIVSRELGVPAVLGTETATQVLSDDQPITIDGDRGTVEAGAAEPDEEREPVEDARPTTPVKPMTATEVKVNVSIPEAAERAAATGADGVGLLRTEHMILSTNVTPERYVETHGERAYTDELVDSIRTVADEFYPRPVRVRTLDAPTDEFRQLEGGESEPHEHNPMLGYRGIRRSLEESELFELELAAFARLYEMGYDNVEVMFPLVNDGDDARAARDALAAAGVDIEKRRWGVMVETPAAALCVADFCDVGADFVSFGTNDLTQYTLAVDRNNEHVADRYDELHPGVLALIENVIETCRERDVDTSICGQAGSKPEMVDFLVERGVSSISANVDAVRDVQHEAKRVEQRLILDSVR